MFAKRFTHVVAAGLTLAASATLYAQIRITEVAPWGSGSANTPYAADWFELTNFGSAAVNISGWTMDDDSNNPNSALLSGVTSIAPGESAIFVEGSNATTLKGAFLSSWFGANAPSGLQIGTYAQGVAGGVGLSTGGDTVSIFSGTQGTLQAKVTFGNATTATPFRSFDNAAGLDNQAISALSELGVNGAFQAVNGVGSNVQIGSPGVSAAVPEPETYAMMLCGLGMIGLALRRRQRRQSARRFPLAY
jgi:hypothetical protein